MPSQDRLLHGVADRLSFSPLKLDKLLICCYLEMTFLTAVLESASNSLAIVLKQSYWSWLTRECVTYIISNTVTVHYSHFPLQLFSGW